MVKRNLSVADRMFSGEAEPIRKDAETSLNGEIETEVRRIYRLYRTPRLSDPSVEFQGFQSLNSFLTKRDTLSLAIPISGFLKHTEENSYDVTLQAMSEQYLGFQED